MKKAETANSKVIAYHARRCPICGKPAVIKWRPFCSKRCADIDLGRWLGGSYRIGSDEEAETDGRTEDLGQPG